MRSILLVLFASVLLLLPSVTAATSQASAAATASSVYNAALSYISYVNQSSYLLFYPNLTTAYLDLNKSSGLLTSDPSNAIVYANAARQSAAQQYSRMAYYKCYSGIAVLAFTLVVAAMIYFYMQPVKRGRRNS